MRSKLGGELENCGHTITILKASQLKVSTIKHITHPVITALGYDTKGVQFSTSKLVKLAS